MLPLRLLRWGVAPSGLVAVHLRGGRGGARSAGSLKCSISMDWDTGEEMLSKEVPPLSVDGIRFRALATAEDDTGALMRWEEEEEAEAETETEDECSGSGGGEETTLVEAWREQWLGLGALFRELDVAFAAVE